MIIGKIYLKLDTENIISLTYYQKEFFNRKINLIIIRNIIAHGLETRDQYKKIYTLSVILIYLSLSKY